MNINPINSTSFKRLIFKLTPANERAVNAFVDRKYSYEPVYNCTKSDIIDAITTFKSRMDSYTGDDVFEMTMAQDDEYGNFVDIQIKDLNEPIKTPFNYSVQLGYSDKTINEFQSAIFSEFQRYYGKEIPFEEKFYGLFDE